MSCDKLVDGSSIEIDRDMRLDFNPLIPLIVNNEWLDNVWSIFKSKKVFNYKSQEYLIFRTHMFIIFMIILYYL